MSGWNTAFVNPSTNDPLRASRGSRAKERVSHVIFDMDGTLVDNLDLIVKSFNYAVAEFVGKEFSKIEMYARFGPTLEHLVEDAVPNKFRRTAVERYHEYYRKYFHKYARVYRGITDLLNGLERAAIGVSVCTGSDRRMTQTTLEEAGLHHMFPVIVTADDFKGQKPDPEGLYLAMKLARVRVDETIYLGDSARDIEASRNAGIASAAALWGFENEATLRAQEPNYVFVNPFDALRQLTDDSIRIK